MMVAREQVRQSIFDLTHYWDDTYGVGNWGGISQKELDDCSQAKKVRVLFKDKDVLIRERGGQPYKGQPNPNLKNVSKKERDTFIIEQYKQGVPAMEIVKAMGYQTTSMVYTVLQNNDMTTTRRPQKIDVTREQFIKAIETSSSQDEVASKLSTPKHKITHQSMQTLFKKYDMQEARQTLKRRGRARYLVKDGKTIKFDSMRELALYLGVTVQTVHNKINRGTAEYQVLTWKEMHVE
ncbi:MAG TPA: hypothetical protein K8V00_09895 [Ligilactobacillus acidipiscis]|uniref:Uncharacterized protein n=1 Tax=Ligilactobacillus acidipiscis TaxID=89059 RepID=A0A921FB30_9LACO|nr:hypothetical protein [Ligilactobacillus acidipiscis]